MPHPASGKGLPPAPPSPASPPLPPVAPGPRASPAGRCGAGRVGHHACAWVWCLPCTGACPCSTKPTHHPRHRHRQSHRFRLRQGQGVGCTMQLPMACLPASPVDSTPMASPRPFCTRTSGARAGGIPARAAVAGVAAATACRAKGASQQASQPCRAALLRCTVPTNMHMAKAGEASRASIPHPTSAEGRAYQWRQGQTRSRPPHHHRPSHLRRPSRQGRTPSHQPHRCHPRRRRHQRPQGRTHHRRRRRYLCTRRRWATD